MTAYPKGVRPADSFSLRPSRPDDREFLVQLYLSTRAGDLSLLGEPLLRTQYQIRQSQYVLRFVGTSPQIILTPEPAGVLWLAQSKEELRIVDIGLMPHLRGRGLGSAVISYVLGVARGQQLPVALTVAKANPGAHRLYLRLGFQSVTESDLDIHMRRDPPR